MLKIKQKRRLNKKEEWVRVINIIFKIRVE